jgi:hypothetical protein
MITTVPQLDQQQRHREIESIHVHLDGNDKVVRVRRTNWRREYSTQGTFAKSTFPLTLSYAMTGKPAASVHSSLCRLVITSTERTMALFHFIFSLCYVHLLTD